MLPILTTATDAGSGAGSSRLLFAVRLLLAAFFVFLACKNLSGDERMAADFRRWGYADGFRVAVALAQIVGAAALLVPALLWPGALLLAGILMGAVVTHARFDPLAQLVAPVVCLALLVPVLWSARPGFLR